MVPGMGLTIIGIAGVGLSLAGIARTFLEGMHAISALVMLIGMIILATGILKDGLPTSNTAKATVIIILGFLVTFGMFMIGMSTVPTLPLFTGVLLLIIIPAIVIAYAAHKQSTHFRGIAIIFSSASAVGAIMLILFGFFAPHAVEAGVTEQPATHTEQGEKTSAGEEKPAPTVPSAATVNVEIVAGAVNQNNTDFYVPQEETVSVGTKVVWTNNDTVGHTVTSGKDATDSSFGKLFDSGFPLLKTGATFEHTFDKAGEYAYFCQVHPWMRGEIIVK